MVTHTNSKGNNSMGWLQHHLETFVRPVLGHIPVPDHRSTPFFTSQEMSRIKSMWRSIKCEARRSSKPLLLAGRDVFIFEILARREGFPTTFRPEISRLVAPHVKEDLTGYYLFDTGFMGSIPRTLGIPSYNMVSSNEVPAAYGLRRMGHQLLTRDPKQVFPRMKGARSLALKIERTPKYWKSGFYREACKCEVPRLQPLYIWERADPPAAKRCFDCLKHINVTTEGIGQEFSNSEEFHQAALLTIAIYKDSSPAFSEGQLEGHRSAW